MVTVLKTLICKGLTKCPCFQTRVSFKCDYHTIFRGHMGIANKSGKDNFVETAKVYAPYAIYSS